MKGLLFCRKEEKMNTSVLYMFSVIGVNGELLGVSWWSIVKNFAEVLPSLVILFTVFVTVFRYTTSTPLERAFATGTDRAWMKLGEVISEGGAILLFMMVFNLSIGMLIEYFREHIPGLFSLCRVISQLSMFFLLPLLLIIEEKALSNLAEYINRFNRVIPGGKIYVSFFLFLFLIFPTMYILGKELLFDKVSIFFKIIDLIELVLLLALSVELFEDLTGKKITKYDNFREKFQRYSQMFSSLILLIALLVVFPFIMKKAVAYSIIVRCFDYAKESDVKIFDTIIFLLSEIGKEGIAVISILLIQWQVLILLGGVGFRIDIKQKHAELMISPENSEDKLYVYGVKEEILICGKDIDQNKCDQYTLKKVDDLCNEKWKILRFKA